MRNRLQQIVVARSIFRCRALPRRKRRRSKPNRARRKPTATNRRARNQSSSEQWKLRAKSRAVSTGQRAGAVVEQAVQVRQMRERNRIIDAELLEQSVLVGCDRLRAEFQQL